MPPLKKRTRQPPRRRLLQQLFASLQKQLDALEARSEAQSEPEREAKLLTTFAATLERLLELDEKQMAKRQNNKQSARTTDRDTIIRTLCERLEKLARSKEPAAVDAKSRGSADSGAG